jgi:hypothetical protein
MPEAARLREQAENVLRLARQTSGNLTSACLTELAKEYFRTLKRSKKRKAMMRPMSESVPTRGRRLE